MKFIDKLLRKYGYEKASRIAELMESVGSRFIDPSYGENLPENFAKNITAYKNEVWVYACVYVIANTIAGLPWRLFKWKMKDGKQVKEEVINDVIETLLEHPNPSDPKSTFYNLIEWTVANLELIGNAYWLNDELYGNPRKPKAIINLMSSRVTVMKGTTAGMISGYKFHTNTAEGILYSPEEITHFMYMAPDNYFYGQSSFGAARYSIDTIKEAQKQNLKIFKNGMSVDQFFETEQKIDGATYTRLMNQIKSRYVGSDKAHTQGILSHGLKYNAVMGNLKDLEYVNGIKLSREDICGVHGVPPLLVGILDQASYSNYESAIKVFFYFNIIPKLHRLNETITRLVQKFDKSIYFEFDTSNEEALKENEQAKATTAQVYFNMGIPFNIINQRLNLGFPTIEGGDIGYLPFSIQPASMVTENSQPVEPAIIPEAEDDDDEEGDNEGKMKSVKRVMYTKENKALLWKQFNRTMIMIEKGYMKIIQSYFMGLEMGILRKLENGKSYNKDVSKKTNVDLYLFDEADEIKRWNKQNTRVHEFAMKTEGNRQLVNLGLGAVFDVSNPAVVKYLKEFGLEKATEVIGSNAEAARKTLIAGVEAGEGIPELKKRIQAVYEPYTDKGYKAERIAQTEVIGASNQGALESYKQADVGAYKAWLTDGGANVRDTHIHAGNIYSEDNAIPLNEDFKVGAGSCDAPGNTGLAEEDINCHCAMIPVIKE